MGYEIIEKLTNEQIKDLHTLFQSEWWTKGRDLSDVQRMVENSDVIVGLCESKTKELIGFTRVLTDYVYKALILDVIVKKSYRGKDLGRILMDTVFEHPSLIGVKHFELYCRPEMLPFYRKWGFTEDLGELHFMRKVRN
ncbi:GNAT family N-acetyltransferase (plasmid) [Bacillus methanolicus]|uniref:GNAT family N-acetyltransferase n=1 Tax=Bacillus methanolicus TaxID=1471 RepID=UPI0023804397|nr:GNAT family N-acetyltransferase [Bacillus methanolicus]MDE3841021.1 GNAT family N-acetyltransferase [Bacillus methanolicus]